MEKEHNRINSHYDREIKSSNVDYRSALESIDEQKKEVVERLKNNMRTVFSAYLEEKRYMAYSPHLKDKDLNFHEFACEYLVRPLTFGSLRFMSAVYTGTDQAPYTILNLREGTAPLSIEKELIRPVVL